MEYFEGGDLLSYLEKTNFSLKKKNNKIYA